MNRQKGITLIALVITIIVLLILAGVAISALAGNDNILKNAGTAVEKYNEKAEAEEAVLNTLEKKLIEFSNGQGTDTPQLTLQEDLEQNPEKYRNSAQSASNTDIAIAENGDKVNLDKWDYQLRTNSETASLASTATGEAYYELINADRVSDLELITGHSAYKGTIDNGAITEKIPAYIRNSATGKAIPVKKLSGTFIGLSITTAPEIPSTVTEIGGYAFWGCKTLKTITIPSSVTSIGDYAFYECYELSTITIPNSVTSIGNNAFQNCTKLSTIEIPSGVTTMGWNVFSGWNANQKIYYKGDTAQSGWDSGWRDWCSAEVYFNNVKQD